MNVGKRTWTKEEEQYLDKLYSEYLPMNDIVNKLNNFSNTKRSYTAISSKAVSMGLPIKYMKSNNPNFKAVYQDYDWCYERFINKGMTMQEMAEEAGTTVRTIQKWCSEKYGLNDWTFKVKKKLNELQYQIIMFGRLGDGHIDKRVDQPMYIEVHAENQKDYLFWKWNILKDICNKEPVYYPKRTKEFNGKIYNVQATYRLNTRVVDDLKLIRSMKIKDIIIQLNEFGLSLHMLDDGYRGYSNWQLCLADYSQDDIDLYMKVCQEKFGLYAKQLKDNRYIQFDSKSSRNIDEIILNNIPNNLDIIKYKILNANLSAPANYIYVNDNGNLIGLSTFCREHKLFYEKCKRYVNSINENQILSKQLYDLKEHNYETVC